MKRIIISVFFLLLIVCSCDNSDSSIEPRMDEPSPIGEFIDDWTYKVYPQISDNFNIGEFRLWVPEEIDNLKAVLVLANSHNSNGLGMVLNTEWQEYAKKENLALLSVHLKSTSPGTYYGRATGGSGRALIHAIDTLAHKHDLNELKSLPLLSRGYSAGGVFGYYMSEYIPDRMVGFANIRGGSVGETSSVNRNIPGIMLMGEMDNASRNQNMMKVVNQKRVEGGLWCYVTQPNADHFGSLEDADELVKQFFSIVLKKRLSIDGSNQLQTLSESSGWLGDNISMEYFLFEKYPDSEKEASWLIDEDFAKKWQEFQIK